MQKETSKPQIGIDIVNESIKNINKNYLLKAEGSLVKVFENNREIKLDNRDSIAEHQELATYISFLQNGYDLVNNRTRQVFKIEIANI